MASNHTIPMHSLAPLILHMIKYSVVIPTRDRFAYLNSAIQSCLFSDRYDIEVVVSINGTKTWGEILQVYQPIQDSRVRYVLTGELLSMQRNYNFGILQARGEYITTIGDDDALLPSAFTYADSFFAQHPQTPICWFRRPYFWPDYEQQPFSPLKSSTLHYWNHTSISFQQSAPILEACAKSYVPYHVLPSIYNSFYPSSLIYRLRKAQNELEGSSGLHSVFLRHTEFVDVFTAYSSLILSESFALISLPLSLSGISVRSNGMDYAKQNPGNEAVKFASESSNKALKLGPFAKYNYLNIQISNEACNAIDAYSKFSEVAELPKVDCNCIAISLVNSYIANEYISQPWAVLDMIRLATDFGYKDSLQKLLKITAWYFSDYEIQLKRWWLEQESEHPPILKQSDNYFILNCASFGVKTAFQAALLYQRFLDGDMPSINN